MTWWHRLRCFVGAHRWVDVVTWLHGGAHAWCADCETVECVPPAGARCPVCGGDSRPPAV